MCHEHAETINDYTTHGDHVIHAAAYYLGVALSVVVAVGDSRVFCPKAAATLLGFEPKGEPAAACTMLNRVAAPRHWNLAVQPSCDWGASNIAAAKEAEAEQIAKEARAQKEQKAKEKAEKAENKEKEKAEKAEKKAKEKAEKAQAAAASLAAEDKSNHDAAAPAPAHLERAERSANASELLHSTDPSADLLNGNATEAFESDPSSALAHLHISTGIHHPGMFGLGRIALGTCPEDEKEAAILSAEAALKTIAHGIEAGKLAAGKAYLNCRNPLAKIYSCAACGMRQQQQYEAKYKRIPLSELNLLAYHSDHDGDGARRKRVEETDSRFRPAFSYYVASCGTWYHLHPEFVDKAGAGSGSHATETSALLCPSCAGCCTAWNRDAGVKRLDKVRPPRSVSAGCDFGDLRRVGLKPLSRLEYLVLAQVRPYMVVCKFSGKLLGKGEQPVLRGQCIAFRQPGGVQKLAEKWDPNSCDLHKFVSITFVGSREQYERRLAEALPFGAVLRQPDMKLIFAYAEAFKALGYPGFENFEANGDHSEATEYYGGERGAEGSFLNRVYNAAEVQSTELACDVDAMAADADPSGAQQQAAAVFGPGPPGVRADAEVVIEDVYVGPHDGGGDGSGDPASGALKAAAALFGVNSDDNAVQVSQSGTSTVKIPRVPDPVNEFTDNSQLYMMAFPAFFCLGTGPLSNGTLSTADARHLLLQFNPEIGACAILVFILFNQLQRHVGSSKLAAAVKNNSAAFAEFLALSRDPATVPALQDALQNGSTPEAIALVSKLERIVSVTAAFVPFSGAARKAQLGNIIAMVRFVGLPTVFPTVSPDPIGDVAALRATFPTRNNISFPATDGGFLASVQKGVEFPVFDLQLLPSLAQVSPDALIKRATANAVRSAEGYNEDNHALFLYLLGMSQTNRSRRSAPRHTQRPGIFGDTTAAFAVTECNGKGWNHLHMLLFAMLASWMMQAAAGIKALHKPLALVIDQCIKAELPESLHLQSLLAGLHGFPKYRGPWYVARALSGVNSDAGADHAHHGCVRTNMHGVHGTRCRKPPHGTDKCSQCFARENLEETKPVQIRCVVDDETGKKTFEKLAGIAPGPSRPGSGGLVQDRRVLVIEPKRPAINAGSLCKAAAAMALKAPGAGPVAVAAAKQDKAVAAALHRLGESKDGPIGDDAYIDAVSAALFELKQAQESGRLADASVIGILVEVLTPEYQLKLDAALRERNMWVADYNETLTALRGCNTAVYLLSSGPAAKSALFYIMDYITKDPTERAATLSLTLLAKADVDAHPSVAANSGSEERTAQHWLNRILNKFNGSGEYSAMLAASCLLGGSPEPATHGPTSLNVLAAMQMAFSYLRTIPSLVRCRKASKALIFF